MAPHVKPPPKAANTILSPFLNFDSKSEKLTEGIKRNQQHRGKCSRANLRPGDALDHLPPIFAKRPGHFFGGKVRANQRS